MQTILNELNSSAATAILVFVTLALLVILWKRLNQIKRDQEHHLTEYSRYLYELLKYPSDSVVEAEDTSLSLSLSLGQEELSGSSCPPFHSWFVWADKSANKTL